MTVREESLNPKFSNDQYMAMIAACFEVVMPLRMEGAVDIWTESNKITQGVLVEPDNVIDYIQTKETGMRIDAIAEVLGLKGKCLLIRYQTDKGYCQANALIHIDVEEDDIELIEFYPRGRSNKLNILPYPIYATELFEDETIGKFSRRKLNEHASVVGGREFESDSKEEIHFSCTYYPNLFNSPKQQQDFVNHFVNGPLFSP